jgi:protein involved in polysaccharide export with SLBB domain
MRRLIAYCAMALALATQTLAQPQTEPQTAPAVQTADARPLPPAGPVDNTYQLGAGDNVRVTVFGEAELSGEYQIAANGTLAFPLVGEVAAQGKTPQELSTDLAARLRQGFLREPRVSVAVTSYRPFYILGEVQNPGTYPYAPDLDVLSAVAVAGGFTYRANRSRVYIRRLGAPDEVRLSLRDRVMVRPGDTIRIGERFF